jgi:hypothetical protein
MRFHVVALAFLLLMPATSTAQEVPAKVQAALILKLLKFYKNIEGKEFSVFVFGDSEVTPFLQANLNQKVGEATLKRVESGTALPSTRFDVVYIAADAATGSRYCAEHQSLSVTGVPELTAQGVTLGLAIEAGKPKILLNISQGKNEGVNWDPAILKIASKTD